MLPHVLGFVEQVAHVSADCFLESVRRCTRRLPSGLRLIRRGPHEDAGEPSWHGTVSDAGGNGGVLYEYRTVLSPWLLHRNNSEEVAFLRISETDNLIKLWSVGKNARHSKGQGVPVCNGSSYCHSS